MVFLWKFSVLGFELDLRERERGGGRERRGRWERREREGGIIGVRE